MVTSLIQGDERLEAISCKFFRKKDDLPLPCSRSFEVAKQFRGKAAFPERRALYYRHAF